MTIEYSGRTSAYEHKHNFDPSAQLSESTNKGLRKVWFLDAQWSTCPVEVEAQVKDLWKMYECGNDKYIIKMGVEELKNMNEFPEDYCEVDRWTGMDWISGPIKVDAILQYIKEQGVCDDEQVIIHWWW